MLIINKKETKTPNSKSRAPSQRHPPTSVLLLRVWNAQECPSQLLKDLGRGPGRLATPGSHRRDGVEGRGPPQETRKTRGPEVRRKERCRSKAPALPKKPSVAVRRQRLAVAEDRREGGPSGCVATGAPGHSSMVQRKVGVGLSPVPSAPNQTEGGAAPRQGVLYPRNVLGSLFESPASSLSLRFLLYAAQQEPRRWNETPAPCLSLIFLYA
ncbi:uncharacterized protein LOC134379123 [Cynocephalus volans]|uniref:uncharacterized protein LOC134379123 n=1 Tax=Cynocephalus volans TaxID=110931 RepID=UPI002FCB828A